MSSVRRGKSRARISPRALLARAAGSSRPAEHAPARMGEQKRSCIDPSAAARAIGWRPEVPLADGLARTLEFFRARR